MKTYTITVTGKTESDIEASIDEAKKRILSGTNWGRDENDTASFEYHSEGNYEEIEE